MTTTVLRYHFAGRADLGEVLIARYASRFGRANQRRRGPVVARQS